MKHEKVIFEIYEDYRNEKYDNKMKLPESKKYPDDYVFDEDKSVRWNKEEVNRRNKEVELNIIVYKEETSRLRNELAEDIIQAILNDYNVTRKQAEKIYSKAYADKHSYFGDVFDELHELAQFYLDMRDLETKV